MTAFVLVWLALAAVLMVAEARGGNSVLQRLHARGKFHLFLGFCSVLLIAPACFLWGIVSSIFKQRK